MSEPAACPRNPGSEYRRSRGAAVMGLGHAFALLVILLLLGGCGDTTDSDTVLFIAANDEGDPARLTIIRVVNGGPLATVTPSGLPNDLAVQGIITIAAQVGDTDTGGGIDILGEYSTDGGVTWRVATGFLNPSPPAAFANGATTYNHDPGTSVSAEFPSVNAIDFVWNSVTDLGTGVQVPRLIFRLTPDDRTDGGVADTVTIAVDNRPSVFAPEADQVTTPTVLPGIVVPGANITFTYRLKDTDNPANLVGICPLFAVSEGTFVAATEAPSPPAVSQGVFGLSASASGNTHVFVWDSAADFATAGVLCSENVVFRVMPKDIGTILSEATGTTLEGISGDSGPFTVANFPASANRPVADVPTPLGVQAGCLQIAYSVADTESSPVAIVVEFSTDGGATFQLATENEVDVDSEGFCGAAGIVTSPVGIGHIFAWDTISDGLFGLVPNVIVRITPFDGAFGIPDATASFVIDNPAVSTMSPPGVTITTPQAPAGGSLSDAINIGFQLFDVDGDPVDIVDLLGMGGGGNAEFSTDGGITFQTATFRTTPAFSGNTGLASSPCGTPHIFVWDSLCDLIGLGAPQLVVFRITPADIHGTGAADVSDPFPVQNSTLPTISAFSIVPGGGTPFTGGIDINYELISTVLTSCAQIVPEFSTNGINFSTATEVVGPPSQGLTDLTSETVMRTGHIFRWDSVADGVGLGMVAQTVTFRIRPFLAGAAGSPDTSMPFLVVNP